MAVRVERAIRRVEIGAASSLGSAPDFLRRVLVVVVFAITLLETLKG